jgi:hypothetical protein
MSRSAIACSRPPSKLCAVAEQSDDHKQMIVRSLDPTSLNPADARGAEQARIELFPNYDAEQGMGHVVSSFIQGGSQIVHLDLASKASTLLWKCDGHNCFALPSPDGHHLAIYTWKRNANIWMMENF